MVDPTEVSSGDELKVTVKTPYQYLYSDLQVGVMVVRDVVHGGEDEPTAVTFDCGVDGDYPVRRALWTASDGWTEFQRTRGDPADEVWCTLSVENGLHICWPD